MGNIATQHASSSLFEQMRQSAEEFEEDDEYPRLEYREDLEGDARFASLLQEDLDEQGHVPLMGLAIEQNPGVQRNLEEISKFVIDTDETTVRIALQDLDREIGGTGRQQHIRSYYVNVKRPRDGGPITMTQIVKGLRKKMNHIARNGNGGDGSEGTQVLLDRIDHMGSDLSDIKSLKVHSLTIYPSESFIQDSGYSGEHNFSIAFHNFSNDLQYGKPKNTKSVIVRLLYEQCIMTPQLPFISCIFEALCCLHALSLQRDKTVLEVQQQTQWHAHVQLQQRTWSQLHQVCKLGLLEQAVIMYNQQEDRNVFVVNVHDADQSVRILRQQTGQHCLVYHSSHVYPFTRQAAELVISRASSAGTSKFVHQLQACETFIMRSRKQQIRSVLNMYAQDEQKVRRTKLQYMYQLPEEDKKRLIANRRQYFEKHGMCGLDIETLIDDEWAQTHGDGNCRPFCLSLSGTLMRLVRVQSKSRNIVYKTVLDKVNCSFWGLDCIQQFIQFLVQNQYYQHVWMQKFRGKQPQKLPLIKNHFFAHNGCKFDYKFLFEDLVQHLGEFDIVGNMQALKSFKGQGLFFYDTSMIFTESLDNVSRSILGPNVHKLTGEGRDLGIGQTMESFGQLTAHQISLIKQYCEQDAWLVKEVGIKFHSQIYTTEFNGVFCRQPIHFSAANLAYTIFKDCFLEVDIKGHTETLAMERQSYRGGFTCTYRSRMGAGISIDINSSYPASMMNKMPLQLTNSERPIEYLDTVHQAYQHIVHSQLVPYHLYEVKFEFPETQLFPSLPVAYDGTLMTPLRCSEENVWMWGVELQQAIKQGGATVMVRRTIAYQGEHTHREFITYFYEKKKSAKQAGDKLMEKTSKLMMNSEYGKHGQQMYAPQFLGSLQSVHDKTRELMQEGVSPDQLKIESIPGKYNNLFTLQRHVHDDDDDEEHQAPLNSVQKTQMEKQQVGSTVRFASYIAALSRVNLFNACHYMVQQFGPQCIIYMDTDSIYAELAPLSGQQYTEYMGIRDIVVIRDKQCHQHLFQQLNIDQIKQFYNTLMVDPQNVECSEQNVRLLDDYKLGCYKIEKLIHFGIFLGQKQYTVICNEEDEVVQAMKDIWMQGCTTMSSAQFKAPHIACKLKGVPARDREVNDLWRLYLIMHQQFLNERTRCPVALIDKHIKTQFASKGFNTNIHSMTKMIAPTFTKRVHNLQFSLPIDSSVPFETPEKGAEHRATIQEQIKLIKKINSQQYNVTDGPDISFVFSNEKIRSYENFKTMIRTANKFQLTERVLSALYHQRNRICYMNFMDQLSFQNVHRQLVRSLERMHDIPQHHLIALHNLDRHIRQKVVLLQTNMERGKEYLFLQHPQLFCSDVITACKLFYIVNCNLGPTESINHIFRENFQIQYLYIVLQCFLVYDVASQHLTMTKKSQFYDQVQNMWITLQRLLEINVLEMNDQEVQCQSVSIRACIESNQKLALHHHAIHQNTFTVQNDLFGWQINEHMRTLQGLLETWGQAPFQFDSTAWIKVLIIQYMHVLKRLIVENDIPMEKVRAYLKQQTSNVETKLTKISSTPFKTTEDQKVDLIVKKMQTFFGTILNTTGRTSVLNALGKDKPRLQCIQVFLGKQMNKLLQEMGSYSCMHELVTCLQPDVLHQEGNFSKQIQTGQGKHPFKIISDQYTLALTRLSQLVETQFIETQFNLSVSHMFYFTNYNLDTPNFMCQQKQNQMYTSNGTYMYEIMDRLLGINTRYNVNEDSIMNAQFIPAPIQEDEWNEQVPLDDTFDMHPDLDDSDFFDMDPRISKRPYI